MYGKMLIGLFIVVIILIIIALIALSIASRNAPDLGMHNGKLMPCPDTPNCQCSEYAGDHYIEPVKIDPDQFTMEQAVEVIKSMDGKLIITENYYIRAEFTTTLLRFIDDFELRFDNESGLLHIRSASRVGHSDLGKNRQRIDKFKSQLLKNEKP